MLDLSPVSRALNHFHQTFVDDSGSAVPQRAFAAFDRKAYAPHELTVPVTLNPDLSPGDPLDSELFPVVWRDGTNVPYRPGAHANATASRARV